MITTSRKYVVAFLLLLFVITVLFTVRQTPSVHAQTTKSSATTVVLVQGGFSCYYHKIVNMWVQSSGGGSKFVDDIRQTTPSGYDGYYHAFITTTLPTTIRLHVGCGGTKWNWWSDNWTPNWTIYNNTVMSGSCNDTQHAYGANQRCWYGESTAQDGAITWAKKFITSPPGDAYANQCLTFDFKAYEQQSINVRGMVKYPINGGTYPSDMYKFISAGLQGNDQSPPAGALVFFMPKPGFSKIYSHVELSVGGGMMISTSDTVSHTVHWETLQQHAHSGAWNYYVGWWLFA